jgi:hypothetical protein
LDPLQQRPLDAAGAGFGAVQVSAVEAHAFEFEAGLERLDEDRLQLAYLQVRDLGCTDFGLHRPEPSAADRASRRPE